MEAKAQLVGIHERVRSDFEGNIPRASSSHSAEDAKRATSASNLNENAAELMRYSTLFCLQLDPNKDKFVHPLPVFSLIPFRPRKEQRKLYKREIE